jgi:hypothetical protein
LSHEFLIRTPGLSCSALETSFETTTKGEVMNANNEQFRQDNEQTMDARVPYEPPMLTVMGKVEHLTALLSRGTPDLLSHGNIL